MKQGFTLLELSIVLVIIGLIIGGITVGADMVRSAELNSVANDFNKYQTAVNVFKLKYNALPGDMKNAEAYWGQAATGNACETTSGTGTQTCNGDGDGKILNELVNNERFRFWQHLSNAELISGNFSGITDTAQHHKKGVVIGWNTPETKITGAVFYMMHLGNQASSSLYSGNYKHTLWLGLDNDGSFTPASNPLLNPVDAHIIDTKVDDGRPSYGKIRVPKSTLNPNCTTSDSESSAEYALSQEGTLCSLMLVLMY